MITEVSPGALDKARPKVTNRGGCGTASADWDLADALGLPTPSFLRNDQHTTLAPDSTVSSGPLLESTH